MTSTTIDELSFVGAGGARLAGLLHRPAGEAKGSVLLAHCFTCGKDLHTLTRLARGLADAGWAALRFDFTGIGESEGDFASTTVATDIGDLSRAAVALIDAGFGPCRLIGHSLGGAAALLTASRLKTVTSVVTLAAPSSTEHVTHLFSGVADEIAREGAAKMSLGGPEFTITQGFIDELAEHSVLDATASLERPLLVVHADDDTTVDPSNADALFAAASEPKQQLRLSSGGHLFASRSASDAVLDAVLRWFDQT